jgi:hypothetical protein
VLRHSAAHLDLHYVEDLVMVLSVAMSENMTDRIRRTPEWTYAVAAQLKERLLGRVQEVAA